MDICARDAREFDFSLRNLTRHFAADRRDLPLEIAQTGFFRILGDDAQHGIVGDLQMLGRNAVIIELSRNQNTCARFPVSLRWYNPRAE